MALLPRITHSRSFLWTIKNFNLQRVISSPSPRLQQLNTIPIPNRKLSALAAHRIRPDLGFKSTNSSSSYKSVDGVIFYDGSRRGFGRTAEVSKEVKPTGGKEMSGSGGEENPKSGSSLQDSQEQKGTISKKSKLKQAVKDYGATVVVFHVTMSLCSLGICYFLVSSGLDLPVIMQKLGIGESILENRITQGASTFVVAYAVHKVFAPVRMGITLTATPLIVRKLRTMGILKVPKS